MWTLRSRIIWHRSQKRHILCGRYATTSRGVLEAYSSQKPQSATVRLSMWKGAPNNAEGKAKQCIGVMMSFCSILLRFLNRTFQNAEIRCSVWKQTEAHWSIAAAKRMNWKWSSVRSDCEFGDMKGVFKWKVYLSPIFFIFYCFLPHISGIFSKPKLFLQSQWIRLRQSWLYNTHSP